MNLSKLQYHPKWIDFSFISEEEVFHQNQLFDQGEDKNTEHFRYGTFLKWMADRDVFTRQEIEQFVELAMLDPNQTMAGSAVSTLFTSSRLSHEQLTWLKLQLPKFGDWTKKLISREELKRKIKQKPLDASLLEECFKHKKAYNENTLFELRILITEDQAILENLLRRVSSKKIKNLAKNKLRKTSSEI